MILDALLAAGAGAARGLKLGQNERLELLERKRKAALEQAESEQNTRRLDLMEQGQQNEYNVGMGRNATDTARLGLEKEELGRKYENLVPGGFNIGGQNIPGRADVMDSIIPYFREQEERGFRRDNPSLFAGSGPKVPTREEMIMKLITDVYGSPQLGVRPEAYDEAFGRALGNAQKLMPEIFGQSAQEPEEAFPWESAGSQEDAQKAYETWLDNSTPEEQELVDLEKVEDYISKLPKKSSRKKKTSSRATALGGQSKVMVE